MEGRRWIRAPDVVFSMLEATAAIEGIEIK